MKGSIARLLLLTALVCATPACKREPQRKLGAEARMGLHKACTSDADCAPAQRCTRWSTSAPPFERQTCELPCHPEGPNEGLDDCPEPLVCSGVITHAPNDSCIQL